MTGTAGTAATERKTTTSDCRTVNRPRLREYTLTRASNTTVSVRELSLRVIIPYGFADSGLALGDAVLAIASA
jgi:hypothetical protein